MAKKPETLFKEKVASALKSLSSCYFVKIQQVTIRGTPDFIICLCGRFIAIELKRSRLAAISPIQQFNLEKIAQAGGDALIVFPENWEVTFKELQRLSENKLSEDAEVVGLH